MEARGLRATYYVSGGLMNTMDAESGLMFGPSDLYRLAAAGHELAGHTYNHVNCREVGVSRVEAEIERNMTFFRKHNLPEPKSFALPFGELGLKTKQCVAEHYGSVRGVYPGVQRGAVDTAALRATAVQGGAAGVEAALKDIAELGEGDGWLTVFTHDVRERAGPWGCTPDQWACLLDAALATGAEILLMGEMAERINAIYAAGTDVAA